MRSIDPRTKIIGRRHVFYESNSIFRGFHFPSECPSEYRCFLVVEGWVKCNYDASLTQYQTSGMGWVIRNSHGIFLNCGVGKFEGRHAVEEAEALALIWSMRAMCLVIGVSSNNI
ncbi:unnamed protein product [Brassica napus]|uniref:(rape) hypothetical protein n=1 Tax=Brassica napus TaxID=3708 RepID=A0A816MKB1_BRANA|nr:unnamed protein product [Brassica napus]